MIKDFITLLAGLAGFIAFVYGISLYSIPVAFIVGGVIGMWWSWYVSVGYFMQLQKHNAKAPE